MKNIFTLLLGGLLTTSAFANNIRAVLYQHAPTPATYASWARFAFPRAFRVGQHIAFHENDAQVQLPAARTVVH